MPLFSHIYRHLESLKSTQRPLLILALMLMFWTIFDSIMAYVVPLKILEDGFSKTEMGSIIALSSVFGALFDFVLSRFTRQTTFHRLYFFMFLFCIAFPLLMSIGGVIFIYIMAMASWGIYFDLMVFGNYHFVSSETPKNQHVASFGILDAFRTAGFIIAPLIAGIFVAEGVSKNIFVVALIFLSFAAVLFYVLTKVTANSVELKNTHPHRHFPKINELNRWFFVLKKIYPLIVIAILLYMSEAFFWTLGPLLSESLSTIHPFGSILLSVYFLPALFTGFLVSSVTKRFGKKMTALLGLFIGSLFLLFFVRVHAPLILILLVFISSLIISFVYPAFKGLIADYITQDRMYESEIEGLADISGNLGYIIGPLSAGILADRFGITGAFFVLGLIIICIVSGLFVGKQKFFQKSR